MHGYMYHLHNSPLLMSSKFASFIHLFKTVFIYQSHLAFFFSFFFLLSKISEKKKITIQFLIKEIWSINNHWCFLIWALYRQEICQSEPCDLLFYKITKKIFLILCQAKECLFLKPLRIMEENLCCSALWDSTSITGRFCSFIWLDWILGE